METITWDLPKYTLSKPQVSPSVIILQQNFFVQLGCSNKESILVTLEPERRMLLLLYMQLSFWHAPSLMSDCFLSMTKLQVNWRTLLVEMRARS